MNKELKSLVELHRKTKAGEVAPSDYDTTKRTTAAF